MLMSSIMMANTTGTSVSQGGSGGDEGCGGVEGEREARQPMVTHCAKRSRARREPRPDEFIEALADFLQASEPSPRLRSRLTEARANAEKLLTTEQYNEALDKAKRIAEWNRTL